jgi:hypothetical protein
MHFLSYVDMNYFYYLHVKNPFLKLYQVFLLPVYSRYCASENLTCVTGNIVHDSGIPYYKNALIVPVIFLGILYVLHILVPRSRVNAPLMFSGHLLIIIPRIVFKKNFQNFHLFEVEILSLGLSSCPEFSLRVEIQFSLAVHMLMARARNFVHMPMKRPHSSSANTKRWLHSGMWDQI